MDKFLSWSYVAAAIVLYVVGLVIYRLTFHPLARFPGPKWTAITRLYEGYFDVVQTGQYTFKIAEMHKQYGPIVRISPYELHVNDPAFFDTLYRQDAAYDKYAWAADAFAIPGASITTVKHEVHKARRQPLNPFFSKAKVVSRQDVIRRKIDKLCSRLYKFTEMGTTFNFGAAMTAFTRDAGNEFILGKSYNSLDREDFDYALLVMSQGSGNMWRLTKFVRWFLPAMQRIPIPWIMKTAGEDVKTFFRHVMDVEADTKTLMAAASTTIVDEKAPRTIVHEIMDSKLPPSDKAFRRVFEDVATVTGASFETVATTLRLIFFHIFSNVEVLKRLRAELASAGVTSDHLPDLKTLEQLPYLTAVLREGLRMNPGTATRSARVAPNNDILYDRWRIPAGTAVGMTSLLMHTDERLYPEPTKYNPERWISDGVLKRTGSDFAPFSKGTRSCLGMHMAWAELYMIVSALVQRFDLNFESAKAEDFECASDQFAIGTRSKGNVYATVKKHNT